MGRWEPNARERLEGAALELFEERGFDETTVEDIAQRAGLTKRTFFRHFPDKREALFAGGEAFEAVFVESLAGVPGSAAPLDAVAVTLDAAAVMLQGRRPRARQRQRVITANAELRERELVKLASVAGALARGLRERGVDEPAASLTAEAGIAVFRVAFERWVAAEVEQDLRTMVREALDELRALAAQR